MPAAGASGSIGVTAPSGCAWAVTSNAAWITASASLTGANYTVSASTATSIRTGTITIAGQPFTITQAAAGSTPSADSVSPAYSGGASQILVAQFTDADGYQDLDVINVLINNYLDGRQACYLAYSRPSNVLYIVADSGNAGQLTGKAMDGTGTVGNSQCTIFLANSSVVGNGSTLTLTLNFAFTTSFARTNGSKVIYAAARDTSQRNSGWHTMGAHLVPGAPVTYPRPLGMSPAMGTGLAQTLTFTFQDQSSALNIQTAWVLFNSNIDSTHACSLAYYRPGNQFYLRPDNGDPAQASVATLGTPTTISNSQCSVNMAGASANISGATLTLIVPITFASPAFSNARNAWLAVQTLAGAVSDWQALGTWIIP